MKSNGLNSIVIQRRTVAKTELNYEGPSYEDVSHEITVKYNGSDSHVDWDKVYNAVVGVMKQKEILK